MGVRLLRTCTKGQESAALNVTCGGPVVTGARSVRCSGLAAPGGQEPIPLH
jgi:hypothetical protein